VHSRVVVIVMEMRLEYSEMELVLVERYPSWAMLWYHQPTSPDQNKQNTFFKKRREEGGGSVGEISPNTIELKCLSRLCFIITLLLHCLLLTFPSYSPTTTTTNNMPTKKRKRQEMESDDGSYSESESNSVQIVTKGKRVKLPEPSNARMPELTNDEMRVVTEKQLLVSVEAVKLGNMALLKTVFERKGNDFEWLDVSPYIYPCYREALETGNCSFVVYLANLADSAGISIIHTISSHYGDVARALKRGHNDLAVFLNNLNLDYITYNVDLFVKGMSL